MAEYRLTDIPDELWDDIKVHLIRRRHKTTIRQLIIELLYKELCRDTDTVEVDGDIFNRCEF